VDRSDAAWGSERAMKRESLGAGRSASGDRIGFGMGFNGSRVKDRIGPHERVHAYVFNTGCMAFRLNIVCLARKHAVDTVLPYGRQSQQQQQQTITVKQ